MYLIMNLATGGATGATDAAKLPATMLIDWVRVRRNASYTRAYARRDAFRSDRVHAFITVRLDVRGSDTSR